MEKYLDTSRTFHQAKSVRNTSRRQKLDHRVINKIYIRLNPRNHYEDSLKKSKYIDRPPEQNTEYMLDNKGNQPPSKTNMPIPNEEQKNIVSEDNIDNTDSKMLPNQSVNMIYNLQEYKDDKIGRAHV